MSYNPSNKRLSDKCPAWPTKDRLTDRWGDGASAHHLLCLQRCRWPASRAVGEVPAAVGEAGRPRAAVAARAGQGADKQARKLAGM